MLLFRNKLPDDELAIVDVAREERLALTALLERCERQAGQLAEIAGMLDIEHGIVSSAHSELQRSHQDMAAAASRAADLTAELDLLAGITGGLAHDQTAVRSLLASAEAHLRSLDTLVCHLSERLDVIERRSDGVMSNAGQAVRHDTKRARSL